MKSSLIIIIPLLLGSFALTAQAVPITGQINIQSGTVVLTPNALGAVTAVGGSTNGIVTAVEGPTYPASVVGDTVTYKPFVLNLLAQPITNLWSLTDVVGTGFSYGFNLNNLTVITQSPQSLFIAGSGNVTSTNPTLDPTPGTFTYNITSADGSPTNGVFSFQSNTVSPTGVPDGGNAVILFGIGLIGLAGLSRKFSWAE